MMAIEKRPPLYHQQLLWNVFIVGLLLVQFLWNVFPAARGSSSYAPAPSTVATSEAIGSHAEAAAIMRRFKNAVAIVQRTNMLGMYEKNVCRKEWEIGQRFPSHTEDLTGTLCEPWIARHAVQVLSKLVTPDMEALEWSSGSSTLWLLLRVKSLYSVESSAQWMDHVVSVVDKVPRTARAEWKWKVIAGTKSGDLRYKSNYTNDGYFEEYTQYPATLGRTWDFISVDGRARPMCFLEALRLVKQEGGVLMLDNSERFYYQSAQQQAPTDWPVYRVTGPDGQDTTIWITCKETCHLYGDV